MPKGGARARSGPAPDPEALRRERDAGEWTVLPAEGRAGATPEWPLVDQDLREEELWARLWQSPQAIMWERNGQEIEVALYVRRLAEAESRDASVALGTLVRQMADSLGLTVPGARAARWKIERPAEGPDVRPAAGEASVVALAPGSARARLRSVGGPGGSG